MVCVLSVSIWSFVGQAHNLICCKTEAGLRLVTRLMYMNDCSCWQVKTFCEPVSLSGDWVSHLFCVGVEWVTDFGFGSSESLVVIYLRVHSVTVCVSILMCSRPVNWCDGVQTHVTIHTQLVLKAWLFHATPHLTYDTAWREAYVQVSRGEFQQLNCVLFKSDPF